MRPARACHLRPHDARFIARRFEVLGRYSEWTQHLARKMILKLVGVLLERKSQFPTFNPGHICWAQ